MAKLSVRHKLYFLLIVVLISRHAEGQFLDPHTVLRESLPIPQRLSSPSRTTTSAHKTTGTAKRLIQSIKYRNEGTSIYDSISYRYNGQKGSSFINTIFTPGLDYYHIWNTWRGLYYFYPECYNNIVPYVLDFDLPYDEGYYFERSAPWANTYKPKFKEQYTYDLNGNIHLAESWQWNISTLQFVPYYKEMVTFDAAGKIRQSLLLKANGASLDSFNKAVWAYAPSGKVAALEYWDYLSPGNWSKYEYYYFTYDNMARLIQYEQKALLNPLVESKFKTQIDYANGSKTITTQKWNTAINAYENSMKTIATLDANHNISTAAHYQWNNTTNNWQPAEVFKYYYNTLQQLVKVISTPDTLTYTYGANNQLTECNWRVLSQGKIDKITWHYSTHNQPDFKAHYQLSPSHMQGYYDTIFYKYEEYSSTAVASQLEAAQGLSLYPNPVQGSYAYLSFYTPTALSTQVSITDLTGRLLWHTKENAAIGDHFISLDVSKLQPGVYTVSIAAEGYTIATQKLLKQ